MVKPPALAGKVVIVTGAGKGLGRAYACDLAAAGAAVVVNNRWADRSQPASAEAVAAEIVAAGGRAIASTDAVEDPASGPAMVKQAMDAFGRLDAVVANAGVPEAASFGRQTLAEFRSVFDINFFGTLHLVHAAWPVLLGQKSGRVVLSTSSGGLHGNRGMAAYCSSKAALIGLMRALATEGARAGVRVNAIAPYAATQMTMPYIQSDLAARMRPEAVAPLVTWMLSDACDLNGETLIAGAGRVRRARAMEGRLVDLGVDVAAAVRCSDDFSAPASFSNATDAFAGFLSGIPVTP